MSEQQPPPAESQPAQTAAPSEHVNTASGGGPTEKTGTERRTGREDARQRREAKAAEQAAAEEAYKAKRGRSGA